MDKTSVNRKIFGWSAVILWTSGLPLGIYAESIRGKNIRIFKLIDSIHGFAYVCAFVLSIIWIILLRKRSPQLEILNVQAGAVSYKNMEINLEQKKNENQVWLKKPFGIYFDGLRIIIKFDYDENIIKSIKGMERRAWDPIIRAWVCPVSEYSNVIGIAKRFKFPLDETFANIHQSTEESMDSSIPGSNAHMLKLHNDGLLHLSTKWPMKSDEGYVYIIRATDGSAVYKIGKSTTPDKRVKTVIGQMPMQCEALHCAWFEDHGYVEKLLHNIYADKRVSSEWFRLSNEDITFILSLGQKYDLNPTSEQISQRLEMEDKRRRNYKKFKERENLRTHSRGSSNRYRYNQNRW